jgi:hypothetical protein
MCVWWSALCRAFPAADSLRPKAILLQPSLLSFGPSDLTVSQTFCPRTTCGFSLNDSRTIPHLLLDVQILHLPMRFSLYGMLLIGHPINPLSLALLPSTLPLQTRMSVVPSLLPASRASLVE